MKILKSLNVLSIAAMAALLAGCGGSSKPVLNVYNWADYVDENQLDAFAEEFNCKVVVDTFDSNESMYAKLKAGATGYDVIFPSSYMSRIMGEQEMLIPLDHSKLPNLKNLDPAFKPLLLDKENRFSVPYAFSYTGIGYRSDKIDAPEASWALFADTAYAGRTTLLNDIRETLGAALISLGYPLNSTDEKQINEAADRVIEWKKQIAKFDSEQYKTGIDSAEFILVQGYSSDLLMVMDENENIGMLFPKEGMAATCDEMVIPASADNPELALEFINFMLRPEVAAANMEWNLAQIPNLPAYALIDEEVRSNPSIFLNADVLAKCQLMEDVGDAIALYTKAWDRVKAAE
ncbi:MAG: extracellular solute-binding protein [Pontiellaceae bacterium]|nr:extracellular solute-binding protein [Pontiellaceae bacterium]MBN2785347.1 extracellular solute-binding protein [Pontiellaceae bacterium]